MLKSVMAARATLILILEEEVPVSDLRAPLPVIGRALLPPNPPLCVPDGRDR